MRRSLSEFSLECYIAWRPFTPHDIDTNNVPSANYHKLNLHSHSNHKKRRRKILPLTSFYSMPCYTLPTCIFPFDTCARIFHIDSIHLCFPTYVVRLWHSGWLVVFKKNHTNLDQQNRSFIYNCVQHWMGVRWWVPRKWSYAGMCMEWKKSDNQKFKVCVLS